MTKLEKPIHLLANILHPKYMGQGLASEQQEKARNVLIEQSPSLLPQLYQFQAKEKPEMVFHLAWKFCCDPQRRTLFNTRLALFVPFWNKAPLPSLRSGYSKILSKASCGSNRTYSSK